MKPFRYTNTQLKIIINILRIKLKYAISMCWSADVVLI